MKNILFRFGRIVLTFLLTVSFLLTGWPVGYVRAQGVQSAPIFSASMISSAAPLLIRGLEILPENSLQLNFILDAGGSHYPIDQEKHETERLIKYFLAGLTIPEADIWVNLSPYEGDRIADDSLMNTDLGRDLLEQDRQLKQITASFMSPQHPVGEQFWNKVYAWMDERYHTRDMPVQTFNKVWIVPGGAQLLQQENRIVIKNARLKVMIESDYVAAHQDERHIIDPAKRGTSEMTVMTDELLRTIVIPAIEEEVNTSERFAPLRQIYYSLLLSKWYRQIVNNPSMEKGYYDKKLINGIDLLDKNIKSKIYNQYLEDYKQGSFDMIHEVYDPQAQSLQARKYFSGGISNLTKSGTIDLASLAEDIPVGQVITTINPLKIVITHLAPAYPWEEFMVKLVNTNPFLNAVNAGIKESTDWVNRLLPDGLRMLELPLQDVSAFTQLNVPELPIGEGDQVVMFVGRVVYGSNVQPLEDAPAGGGIRNLMLTMDKVTQQHLIDFEKLLENSDLKPEKKVEQRLKLIKTVHMVEINALAKEMFMKNRGVGAATPNGAKGGIGLWIQHKNGTFSPMDRGFMDNLSASQHDRLMYTVSLTFGEYMGKSVGTEQEGIHHRKNQAAPDVGTGLSVQIDEHKALMMDLMMEGYLRALTEKGLIEDPYLLAQLKATAVDEKSSKESLTPFLDVAVQRLEDGHAVAELAAFSSKSSNKGGLKERESATGILLAFVSLLTAAYQNDPEIDLRNFSAIENGADLEGKTVAAHGLGNVGSYYVQKMLSYKAKVKWVGDWRTAAFFRDGITEKQLEVILNRGEAPGTTHLSSIVTSWDKILNNPAFKKQADGKLLKVYTEDVNKKVPLSTEERNKIINDGEFDIYIFSGNTDPATTFMNSIESEQLATKLVMNAAVDILAINSGNNMVKKSMVPYIQAGIVIEGANSPFDPDAKIEMKRLISNGELKIAYWVPGELANSGGSIVSGLERLYALFGKNDSNVFLTAKKMMAEAMAQTMGMVDNETSVAEALLKRALGSTFENNFKYLVKSVGPDVVAIRSRMRLETKTRAEMAAIITANMNGDSAIPNAVRKMFDERHGELSRTIENLQADPTLKESLKAFNSGWLNTLYYKEGSTPKETWKNRYEAMTYAEVLITILNDQTPEAQGEEYGYGSSENARDYREKFLSNIVANGSSGLTEAAREFMVQKLKDDHDKASLASVNQTGKDNLGGIDFKKLAFTTDWDEKGGIEVSGNLLEDIFGGSFSQGLQPKIIQIIPMK